MTPQERAGMAAAINEAIDRGCAGVLERCARELEAVRRSAEERIAAFATQAVQLQVELEQTRALANLPALRDVLIDSEGGLRIVQRNGDTLTARIVDLPASIAAGVSTAVGDAEQRLSARLESHIARALQCLGAAPKWSATAAYAPGAVVSCYVGRTYALRDGVKASIGQEPGEHPGIWERIGSHGLRLLKSKPAELEPGDVFTDDESRFIHDGESTNLLVPRALKASDLDRAIRLVKKGEK